MGVGFPLGAFRLVLEPETISASVVIEGIGQFFHAGLAKLAPQFEYGAANRGRGPALTVPDRGQQLIVREAVVGFAGQAREETEADRVAQFANLCTIGTIQRTVSRFVTCCTAGRIIVAGGDGELRARRDAETPRAANCVFVAPGDARRSSTTQAFLKPVAPWEIGAYRYSCQDHGSAHIAFCVENFAPRILLLWA